MKKYFIVLISTLLMGENLIAAEAGMPQLDPQYWASQVFWLIIIFLLIYLLIARIFIPKIKSNIDVREDKIRKDLEEAKLFKEDSEKKLKTYIDLINSAKNDAKKILSQSRQKLNEDIQIKKKEIQKEIEKEILNAEKEIKKFKTESVDKVNVISEEIASNLIKNIIGEDLNKSSLKATISQIIKEKKMRLYDS
tara:strand:+ start:5034 stop:5615 length:582 start_codon:yes stop_codon:yes gene_type:complete